MFDKVPNIPWVLNMPKFCIWQSCEYRVVHVLHLSTVFKTNFAICKCLIDLYTELMLSESLRQNLNLM